MNVWIEGARPKTLIASLSPTFIGTVIAFDQGFFHPLVFLFSLLFALAIQVGTNFANDYFDFFKGADTEKRKGPRRLIQSGLVAPKKMKKAICLVFGFALLCALYLTLKGGWIIALLSILSIICGYLYTGGPYPLGYLGIADLFVLIFFGPVAVAGTVYLQTGELSLIPIVAGFAPGLISVSILTSNNLRDLNEDREAGKRTLPVRFGLTFGRFEYSFCLIVAGLIPAILVGLTRKHHTILLASATLILAYPLIREVFKEKHSTSLLTKTGKWMLLYTLVFLVGWIV